MTEKPQDKFDSTDSSEENKSASTAFWQAARVVGGTALAAVILIGTAVAKGIGRRPGGP